MSTDLRRIHFAEIRDYLQGRRQVVHDRLAIHSPITCNELAAVMQWDKCSVRPRICELHHAGLCEPTGERRNGEHVWRWVALGTAEARARADQERQAEATRWTGSVSFDSEDLGGGQLTLPAVM